jgi:uncharacterized protein (DUF305 family)
MKNSKIGSIAVMCFGLALSACETKVSSETHDSTHQQTEARTENHDNANHNMHTMGGMDDMMKMLEGKTGDEFDKAFIQAMRPHHQSAVDMAVLAETAAKHDEIKKLAKDIIAAQKKEIVTMTRWEQQWKYSDGHNHDMPIDQSMTNMLKGKTGDEFDKAFIEMMIPHHEGAVKMAEAAKANAKHQEIKTMADEIINAQNKEISMMRDWQKAWGY